MDTRQLKAFILRGGVAHEYAVTSPLLQEILADAGVSSDISESLEPAENGSLSDYDLLVLNCVYFACKGRPDLRDPGILGAYWEWNISGHPPIMTFPVRVRSDAHPILAGTKGFEIQRGARWVGGAL